jgi:hypothetical protein
MASAALLAQLSKRIRTVSPADWAEFGNIWMAFNAIYGGEPDQRERARVMGSIRRYIADRVARRLLRDSQQSIDRIVAIPPGDMRLAQRDPRFREASLRCIATYLNLEESSRGRLAAVGGVLYQIRCNLLHGGKDPNVRRDRMLVQESVRVLNRLVPALESGAMEN